MVGTESTLPYSRRHWHWLRHLPVRRQMAPAGPRTGVRIPFSPTIPGRAAALMLQLITIFAVLGSVIGLPTPVRAAESVASQQPSVFGLTNLWTIHLTVSPQDWQLMGSRGGPKDRGWNGGGNNNNPGLVDGIFRGVFGGNEGQRPQQNRRAVPSAPDGNSRYPWATCAFESGNIAFTNVGIRFKGVSSFVRAPNGFKRPFKLDFNRGAKGRAFLGAEEFYLNNNVNDATQMREALAYELFRRAGLPAPRTAFARVYLTIPGRTEKLHLGLYTLVEVVEGDFLKTHFGTKKGLLMKPEMMRGVEYMGEDWDNYTARYDPKGTVDPADAKRFIEFVRFVQEAEPEEFAAKISEYLEPEKFTRFVALNSLLANIDSFIGNGHNYYLYQSPTTHKATFIPWDVNEAFGAHPVSGPSGEQMRFSILRPNADPNLLIERFTSDRTLARLYRGQLASLLTNVFVPSKLSADIDRIAAVTKPVVFQESKRARADFERTVLQSLKPDEGDTSQPRHDREFSRDGYRPWGFPDAVEIDNIPLKEWINGRAANAKDQLEGRLRGTRPKARLF